MSRPPITSERVAELQRTLTEGEILPAEEIAHLLDECDRLIKENTLKGRSKVPDERLLRAMAKHIAYDVWMLHSCCLMIDHIKPGTPRESVSLYVEGALIHTRNLVGFLYPPTEEHQHDGDILATDYPSPMELPRRTKVKVAGTDVGFLMKNISQRVAHVHELRADPGVGWSYALIGEAVVGRSLRYLASIEAPYDVDFRREFLEYGWDLDVWASSWPEERALPPDTRAFKAQSPR